MGFFSHGCQKVKGKIKAPPPPQHTHTFRPEPNSAGMDLAVNIQGSGNQIWGENAGANESVVIVCCGRHSIADVISAVVIN